MTDHATTSSPSAGSPKPAADFYRQCMEQALSLESQGSVNGAVNWLHQAEQLAQGDADRRQELSQAYARLIAFSSRKFRMLALHSGNITANHARLSREIVELSGCLKAQLEAAASESHSRAVVIEGLAVNLARTVTALRGDSEHDEITRYVGTPASTLDAVVGDATTIIAHVRQLGLKVTHPYGTSRELLTLARTAVGNADSSLFRLFSHALSDWEKAIVWCRRAAQLLSEHVTVEGGSAAGSSPELDQLFTDLKAAEEKLAGRDYKQSKSALQSALTALDAMLATAA